MDTKEYIVNDVRVISFEVLLDTETPISLYLKARNKSAYSFLLESVEEGNNIGRYSIVGWGKHKSFVAYNDKIIINDKTSLNEELFHALRNFLSGYELPLDGAFNGFFGYLGYESVYKIEPKVSDNPQYGELPLAYFILPKVIAIFDKLSHKVKFMFNRDMDEPKFYVMQELNSLFDELPTPTDILYSKEVCEKEFSSNVTKEDFMSRVEKAKEYILAGDIFQVVLSQRFEADYHGDPFEVYRYLCSLNPSPYMFHFNFGNEFYLMGTSPEIMLKKDNDILTIRPIAGTRQRGKTPKEDQEIENELYDDEKENAEHLMLVDLARNDINRICKSESVNVDVFKAIERYSHVMHIVSSVSGEIQESADIISAIQACFPAGTLSGAPKVRAMQIIHELEKTPREIYGGMVGYFDFLGNFDSCITIRSILMKDNKAYFQAGAGIVADSDPGFEYIETKNKAKAMLKALSDSEG